MATSNYAQEWLDTTLYPFESKYLHLEAGKMHYIDEGEGDVLLFVHGTPTWSFLYREFVKELSADYRCIAIDHIGFGLSEKNESFDGKPESHSKNLGEFINKLDLQQITLVVHDFGGPIGLGAALDNPDRIKQVIAFNTWLWETKNDPDAKKIDKIINSGMGKFLYLSMNFSPKVLLKKAYSNKKYLTKAVHKHYIKPFPTRSSRQTLLNIGKGLVGSSDWYEYQWRRLDKLSNKDWMFLWGTSDPFINTGYLEKWKNRLPGATFVEFESGHFVQEESTQKAIDTIKKFLLKEVSVTDN